MPNIPDAPLTREEQYLAAIANGGGTVPEVPLTRVEQYLNAILQGGGGGGGDVTVDSELSASSENPVQNKVITEALNDKAPLADVSKNLIIRPYSCESQTVNGVTFTINDDGTITASGTATANATFVLRGWTKADGSLPINPSIAYRLKGSPDGASLTTFYVACRIYTDTQTPGSTTGVVKRDTGGGTTWTGASYVSVYVEIFSGQTVNNLVFSPMLTYVGVDDAYDEYGENVIPYLAQAIANKQPANTAPRDVGGTATPGGSDYYARADHVHGIDCAALANAMPNALGDSYAENIPVILYSAATNGVVIQQTPQVLAHLYQSQLKMNFALIIPPDTKNYPVIFTVSSLNTTTGELHMTGITGGVLYEAVLFPNADPIGGSGVAMVGTLTQTNLVQP